jgi:hypothetical protein
MRPRLGEKFGRMENHALIIKTNWEGKPVILANLKLI